MQPVWALTLQYLTTIPGQKSISLARA